VIVKSGQWLTLIVHPLMLMARVGFHYSLPAEMITGIVFS